MKKVFLLICVIGFSIITGCQKNLSRPPDNSNAVENSQNIDVKRKLSLLGLRKKLDLVKAKETEENLSEPYSATCCDDVTFLLSIPKEEIRKVLGDPHICQQESGIPCKGVDWSYSFYVLPVNAVGGGPELWLQFDEAGKCKLARWVISK